MRGMNPLASPVDIRPDHLEIVQGILREHLPEGVKVWVFGSRANWTTKDSSDLDLALECDNRLSHKVLGALKDAFEDSSLPYTVDLVDMNRIGNSFRQIVESQRVPLPLGGNATYREVQLGDVATIVMGQSPPGSTVSDEPGVALLNGPTEFGPYHPTAMQFTTDPRKFAEPGDLLFCVRGSTTGRMNWADQEYAIGRGVAAIRHGETPELQPLVRGVIEIALPKLLAQATGSTFPNVSAQQLAEIPYPDINEPEQRAIAHILGTLDNKIDLNRRMNQTLEEMARALFKSWFVDFDPVRAKMEERWRPGESLPGLPAHLYDLFPDRLVDSELGEIPEGWEVRALRDLVELNPPETLRKGAMAPYLDMAALPTSGSNADEPVLRAFSSGTRFRNGDTLLARITPCLENGKTAFIQSLPKDIVGWGSTEFIVMRPIEPVPAEYGYLLARDPAFREHAVQSMTGTSGRQRVQVDALAPYPLPSPPVGTWSAFGLLTVGLLSRVEENRREIAVLSAQRDVLLPRLVSGKAGIKESKTLSKVTVQ